MNIFTEVTAGIKVSVETFYQPTHSTPGFSQYVFAYRITITNDSEYNVQLKKRHWHIIGSDNSHREVEGEGVVGQQPVIEPGNNHEYVSGCNLKTDIGSMKGSYEMKRIVDGQTFRVNIPEFYLITPFKLN